MSTSRKYGSATSAKLHAGDLRRSVRPLQSLDPFAVDVEIWSDIRAGDLATAPSPLIGKQPRIEERISGEVEPLAMGCNREPGSVYLAVAATISSQNEPAKPDV